MQGANLLAQLPEITPGWILLGLLLILGAWLALAYNRLVRLNALCEEAFSGIDVQLKRRHDLIPNLVETVKGYAGFEQDVLKQVTDLRTRAMNARTLEDRQREENALTGTLKTLFAVAEAYPDLKANTNFLDLQQQLAEIENHLQSVRRYYNATVRDYNIAVEQFPSNVVAQLFGFAPKPYFELELPEERQRPDVDFSEFRRS